MNNKQKNILTLLLILITVYFSFELFDKIVSLIKIGFKIIFPIILGLILSFALNPMRTKLVKKKIPNSIASLSLILILLASIGVVLVIVIPNLIEELTKFLPNIPNYLSFVENYYSKYFGKISNNFPLDKLFFNIFNDFSIKIIYFLQTIISYGAGIFISIFIAFYFLLDFDNIINYVKQKTIEDKKTKVYKFLKETKENMYQYLKSLFQENLLLFVISALSFYLLKLEHFISLAFILALTNVIPYLGPYIGGSFAVIVGLNYSYRRALFVLIIIILLQFVDNYIISPKIQSKNNDIKPVIIIISIVILGSTFGIIGAIFAVPLTLIMKTLYKIYVLKK